MVFHNNFQGNTINQMNQNESKRGAESDEESARDKKPSKSSKSEKTSKQKLEEYDVENKALVVIFNQKNFPDKKNERTGTEKDGDALEKSFSDKNHFEIIYKEDKSEEVIKKQLASVANDAEFKNHSYVIICFLSHGDTDGIIKLSCGGDIKNEEIWQPFYSVDSIWKGKPKLFIFQACKGKAYTTDNSKEKTLAVHTDIGKWHKIVPKEADILVAYSTVEGNVSLRDIIDGAWYIQKLCEIIDEYGKCEDILDILTRVNQEIANNCEVLGRNVKGIDKELENKRIKQMPMFLSTLTKKFYFYSPANRT